MRPERDFQAALIEDIQAHWPDAIISKQDANRRNGMPDLLILKGNRWAMLECKKSKHEPFRPNQEYRIDELNKLSFARVIFPENKEDVLNELYRTFES